MKSPSTGLDSEKSAIATRNADVFGRILSIVEAYLRGPSDTSALTVLLDNLSNTP